MKPEIVCLMMSSLDGGLHPSKWTESPDGGRKEWTALYQKAHEDLQGDAWIVGRVTMAEMAKGRGRIRRNLPALSNGQTILPIARQTTTR